MDIPLTPFLQYGFLGIAVFVLGAACVALYQQARANAKREADRADRLETELREINTTRQEKYLTTLTAATEAIREVLAWVRGKGL